MDPIVEAVRSKPSLWTYSKIRTMMQSKWYLKRWSKWVWKIKRLPLTSSKAFRKSNKYRQVSKNTSPIKASIQTKAEKTRSPSLIHKMKTSNHHTVISTQLTHSKRGRYLCQGQVIILGNHHQIKTGLVKTCTTLKSKIGSHASMSRVGQMTLRMKD